MIKTVLDVKCSTGPRKGRREPFRRITLDKMIKGRKTGKHEPARRDAEPNPAKTPTEYESDRKHLTSREVEKLIEGDQLRHACGFALADHGIDRRLIQDCLGYRNIQHTVKYTASNPARFEPLWR